MICSNCGIPLRENARFCVECGSAVESLQIPEPPANPPEPLNAPGRKLIKVSAVIMLIVAAVNLINLPIVWAMSDAAVDYIGSYCENRGGRGNPHCPSCNGSYDASVFAVPVWFLIFCGVAVLYSGFVAVTGIRRCNDVGKARILQRLIGVEFLTAAVRLAIAAWFAVSRIQEFFDFQATIPRDFTPPSEVFQAASAQLTYVVVILIVFALKTALVLPIICIYGVTKNKKSNQ
jgi:hypothetical protein